ncbi:GAF domain-containing sensor histidine kinase [Schauerella aestuarii]|uniref:GAF domain-containing sensor histidine kinase n=1 Tax=Schauerella aestuarii TaxID=2511204 RepID=UPI001F191C5E|nr:GAF domain-containing sensor histidine kinase [Achromobacter aestuarii]
MGFAAVARVTDERWIACAVNDAIGLGLSAGGELKLETTICDEIRGHRQPVVIDHVASDPSYREHHTPVMYGFQSYISVPIYRANGELFGTLCALDPHPAKVNTPATIVMFTSFADLIGAQLDAQDRAAASESALAEERKNSELREQFIAVLGHDLRNPLASIDAGAKLLRRRAADDRTLSIVTSMERSVGRMANLIDNVLDFARGRLGGGLMLNCDDSEPLEPALHQVVAELQSAWPERRIDTSIDQLGAVYCDRPRLAQLLSNLLGNALTHGSSDAPIVVEAYRLDDVLHLAVENAGAPIPPATIERLFQPFFRASAAPAQQGLGLGLYIVSEIAHAHGGTLSVVSDDHVTRFALTMPAISAEPCRLP